MNEEHRSYRERRGSKEPGCPKGQGGGAASGTCACCQPGHEEIARRAYEIWIPGGTTPGHDVDNWIEAERELRQARRRLRHGMAA